MGGVEWAVGVRAGPAGGESNRGDAGRGLRRAPQLSRAGRGAAPPTAPACLLQPRDVLAVAATALLEVHHALRRLAPLAPLLAGQALQLGIKLIKLQRGVVCVRECRWGSAILIRGSAGDMRCKRDACRPKPIADGGGTGCLASCAWPQGSSSADAQRRSSRSSGTCCMSARQPGPPHPGQPPRLRVQRLHRAVEPVAHLHLLALAWVQAAGRSQALLAEGLGLGLLRAARRTAGVGWMLGLR